MSSYINIPPSIEENTYYESHQDSKTLKCLRLKKNVCMAFAGISFAACFYGTATMITLMGLRTISPFKGIGALMITSIAFISLGLICLAAGSYHKDQAIKYTLNKIIKENDDLFIQTNDNTVLPIEISNLIFSYLKGTDLSKCALVSKEWYKRVCQDAVLDQIVAQHAFGAKEWKKYIGKIGNVDPLPRGIWKTYKNLPSWHLGIQAFPPYRKAKYMLIWLPETLNGKSVTGHDIVNRLRKTYLPDLKMSTQVFERIQKQTIEKSGWMFMAQDAIVDVCNKAYENFARENNLEFVAPTAVETLVCIFSEFCLWGLDNNMIIQTSRSVFDKDPITIYFNKKLDITEDKSYKSALCFKLHN